MRHVCSFLGKDEKLLPPQSLNEVEVGKFMELYKSLEHFDVEIIPTRKQQPHTGEMVTFCKETSIACL